MKEYFSHDYEPTSDPKIQALVGEYGAVGYGIFWRIVEMLHSTKEHKLPQKEYIYLAIAKQMLTSVEQTKAILDYCISVCDLFVSDGDYLWSERVNKNIEARAQLSEKRSIAGKAGAIAKQTQAKPSKRNKRKVKEIYIGPRDFYQKQLESLPGGTHSDHYKIFVDFLFENKEKPNGLKNILSIPEQVTFDQFKSLVQLQAESESPEKLSSILLKMENDTKYTKGKQSLYLTLRNWINNRFVK